MKPPPPPPPPGSIASLGVAIPEDERRWHEDGTGASCRSHGRHSTDPLAGRRQNITEPLATEK